MWNVRIGFVAGAVAAVAGFGLATARADTVSCIQQAKSDYQACKAQCQDDYRSAKFTCRGIPPQCGAACLAGREICFDGVDDMLHTGQLPSGGQLANCTGGTDKCKADLRATKTNVCHAPCQSGDEACDMCVDDAQVTSFRCRDECRESWRANPEVQNLATSCRTTFRTCVAACLNP